VSAVAASTGPLRDVLIADDGCVPAWIVRGRCFAAMGCPLLAGLHFEKACTLQSLSLPDVLERWDGAGSVKPITAGGGAGSGSGAAPGEPATTSEVFDAEVTIAHHLRLTRTLLRSFDARALVLLSRALAAAREGLPEAHLVAVDQGVCQALLSPPTVAGGGAATAALRQLDLARTLKAQGDAVFSEAYFATATVKYRAALACCRLAVTGAGGDGGPKEEDVVLQAQVLEFACLLNLATSLQRRHVELASAAQCCSDALKLMSNSAGEGVPPQPTHSPINLKPWFSRPLCLPCALAALPSTRQ
jgi:hypothetical protein